MKSTAVRDVINIEMNYRLFVLYTSSIYFGQRSLILNLSIPQHSHSEVLLYHSSATEHWAKLASTNVNASYSPHPPRRAITKDQQTVGRVYHVSQHWL